MRCRVCGTELEPNAKICRVCGISVSTSSKVAPITLNNKSNNQNNGEDITSFFFNTAPSNDISSRINEGLNSNFQNQITNEFSNDSLSQNNQTIGNQTINNQPFFNNQNSNQDNDIDLNKQQPIQNNQNLNPNNKVSNKMNSNKSVFFQNNQINQVNNSDVNNQNNQSQAMNASQNIFSNNQSSNTINNQNNANIQNDLSQVKIPPEEEKPVIYEPPVVKEKKKSFDLSKKSYKIFFICLIAFATLTLVIVFVTKYVFNHRPSKNDGNDSTINEPIGDNDNDNYEYYMILDGYRFNIPIGYRAEVQEDCLVLINSEQRVQFVLAIYDNTPFDYYLNQVENVASTWQNDGYQIIDNTQKKFGDSTWLIFNGVHNSTILSIAYHKLTDNSTAEMIFVNEGNQNIDDIYNTFEKMLTTFTFLDKEDDVF